MRQLPDPSPGWTSRPTQTNGGAAALHAIPLFEQADEPEALQEARVLLFWAGRDSLRNAEAIAALEPLFTPTVAKTPG